MRMEIPEMLEENENRRIPNLCLWLAVKTFFNYNINKPSISRSDLLDELSVARFGSSTIDTYRNYLHKAGYLQTIGRGLYRVIKEIPIDISIIEIKEEAYGKKHEGRIMFGDDFNEWWTATKKYKRKQNDFISKEEMTI